MTYDDHINMFNKSKPTAERDFKKLIKLNLVKKNIVNNKIVIFIVSVKFIFFIFPILFLKFNIL